MKFELWRDAPNENERALGCEKRRKRRVFDFSTLDWNLVKFELYADGVSENERALVCDARDGEALSFGGQGKPYLRILCVREGRSPKRACESLWRSDENLFNFQSGVRKATSVNNPRYLVKKKFYGTCVPLIFSNEPQDVRVNGKARAGAKAANDEFGALHNSGDEPCRQPDTGLKLSEVRIVARRAQ